MEFREFAFARDFLYLAALFFGLGLGCFINRIKGIRSERLRNAAVTTGLCFFSAAVAALTVASVYSRGLIFTEEALYIPAGITAGLTALALVFPRAAGFPLVLATGAFLVWLAYASLRFPAIEPAAGAYRTGDTAAVQGWVAQGANGVLQVRILLSPSAEPVSFDAAADTLEFRAAAFSLPAPFPIAGGVKRGLISAVYSSGERLYADPRIGGFLAPPLSASDTERGKAREQFFSFEEQRATLDAQAIFPAFSRTIFFDGAVLEFK